MSKEGKDIKAEMKATIRRNPRTKTKAPEYLRAKLLDRFLGKVQITESCWLWVGSLKGNGYGDFSLGRNNNVLAHRFSYAFFVGPIGPGKHILHRRECNNRRCINPNHLYMGSHNDNVLDRMAWGKALKGENHPNAKLSKDDIAAIRKIHENKRGGYEKTAKLFNVSAANIGYIVRGDTWQGMYTT